jgi:hypothetical protein
LPFDAPGGGFAPTPLVDFDLAADAVALEP